jgi:parallel beta-helix repeat protein
LEENTVTGNQGAGLDFAENAAGVARLNRSEENFGGIGVSDEAQPTLEENIITRNVTAGIAYFRSAGGVASRNDCSGNGIDGIAVFEEAVPTLEGNTCNDNGERGISYSGTAGGVARDNECSRNRVGIHAAETSDPDLLDNRCAENTEADIQDLRP